MSEQNLDHGDVGESRAEAPDLHLASLADQSEATARGDELDSILRRADVRDRDAELRDRDAEAREPARGDLQAAIDRDWAGRDRDRAAEDRADMLALLRPADVRPDDSGTDEPDGD